MTEQDTQQHVIHIREPDGSEKLGRFTGRLVEQTDGWDVYLTEDDRVVVYNEASRRAEIKTVDEAREIGSLPRFKKLREVIGPPEPEDI